MKDIQELKQEHIERLKVADKRFSNDEITYDELIDQCNKSKELAQAELLQVYEKTNMTYKEYLHIKHWLGHRVFETIL